MLVVSSALTSATTVGAWTLTNPTAADASIIYNGSKGAVTSSVLITPNSSQIAKVLRGGLAGYALTFAVEQLLGAVDWIMDAENNQIRYHPITEDENPNIPRFWVITDTYINPETTGYSTPELMCKSVVGKKLWASSPITLTVRIELPNAQSPVCLAYTDSGALFGSIQIKNTINPNYDPNEEETLSLETVAQQVIENAEGDNLDAQFAILAATANILLEAEQDEAKAKPIEDELENNSKKCPNGQSRNAYGQCYICGSTTVENQMKNDVQIAKGAHRGLGACEATHKIEELSLRYNNYVNEAVARDKLNACYDIPHQNHLNQAKEAWRQGQEICVSYMAVK